MKSAYARSNSNHPDCETCCRRQCRTSALLKGEDSARHQETNSDNGEQQTQPSGHLLMHRIPALMVAMGLEAPPSQNQISAGRAAQITPELADPLGSLEVGEHEDVEQPPGPPLVPS